MIWYKSVPSRSIKIRGNLAIIEATEKCRQFFHYDMVFVLPFHEKRKFFDSVKFAVKFILIPTQNAQNYCLAPKTEFLREKRK